MRLHARLREHVEEAAQVALDAQLVDAARRPFSSLIGPCVATCPLSMTTT
jgi:hypothetical protein